MIRVMSVKHNYLLVTYNDMFRPTRRPSSGHHRQQSLEEQPAQHIHRSFTVITQYTVHTSCVRLADDEISTPAAQ